jgi:hypothetical protein
VFAMKGGSQGSSKEVVFDNTAAQPAPETSLAPAGAAMDTPAPVQSRSQTVPALNGAAVPHPAPHPAPTHSQEPVQIPTAFPPSPPLPQPPQPPEPAQTAQGLGGKYDGPECQRARRQRALGHSREAQSWALACIAKGGNPN